MAGRLAALVSMEGPGGQGDGGRAAALRRLAADLPTAATGRSDFGPLQAGSGPWQTVRVGRATDPASLEPAIDPSPSTARTQEAESFVAWAAGLRRRGERLAAVRALGLIAASALSASWAAIVAMATFGWTSALAAATVTAATLIAALLSWAWRRPDRQRDDGAWMAAQRVRVGDLQGAERLRTTWELLRGHPHHPMAAGLLRDVRAAERALQGQAARKLRRRAMESALWLSVALAAGLQANASWLKIEQLARQTAQKPTGPRELASLIDDLSLDVEAPTYARDAVPPRRETGEEATVLRGSTVRIAVLPRAGVRDLEIEIARDGSREREEMLAMPGGRLQIVVTADEAFSYRFFGRDAAGVVLFERGDRDVQVGADADPVAVLEEPAAEYEVRPGESVLVAGWVQDDIGLASIDLVIAAPAGNERRSLAVTQGERRVTIRESLEVDRLGLLAGEIATLTLEAVDVAGDGAPRRGRSTVVSLRMVSPDRFHGRLLSRLSELAVAWTVALADRLEGDPQLPARRLADALAAQAAFASREHGLLAALQELRADLDDDVLVRAQPRADVDALDRLLRDRIAEEARGVARLLAERGAESGEEGTSPALAPAEAAEQAAQPDERQLRRDLARLGRLHSRVVDGIERAVLGLVAVALSEHRSALARDARALEKLESRLAEVLAKLRAQPDDPALRAEAERLLDAIGQRLEQMRTEAGRQLQLVPPERVNESALEPTELEGALGERRDTLDRVREALRAGNIDVALQAFEASRSRLASALETLQAEAEAERTAEDAVLDRLIADLRRGIEEARADQATLREALRPAAESQERATADQLQRGLELLLPKIRALLDDARDQLRPKRLATPELRSGRPLADARAALSQAVADLERSDVDSSLLALLEAEGSLDVARRGLLEREAALDREAEGGSPGDRIEGAAQAEQALRQAFGQDGGRVDLARDRTFRAGALLRQLLPRPESLHDQATRRRLAAHSGRQEALRRRLERVRQRLSQQALAQPGLESQVGGRLDHAEQMMRQAGAALGASDATRGDRRMAEAEAALDAAQQMLQRATGQGGQGAQGSTGSQVGRRPDASELPLPDKKATEATDHFRQRVQDAARREAPAGWSERVRRYWLRLGE